jgi:UPF0176 protein
MHGHIRKRNEQLAKTVESSMASEPYDNIRPINVPARFDGRSLFECVTSMHPHVGEDQWRLWFQSGHILEGDQTVPMDRVVRGGNQFQHLFPDWVEPDIDSRIEILWEDDSIIAVAKPAPLPVHPSGRFNRNTLTALLGTVYSVDDLRVVHRLDANTTGLMIFARTASVATAMRSQFEANRISKTYLVRCAGLPAQQTFRCDQAIAKQRGPAGLRSVDPHGDSAITEFHVVRPLDDGTAILVARPKTGRTHQIRIHLWALNIPVFGDPSYLSNRQLAATQTLDIHDPPMCLHADQLKFDHPVTGQSISITGPRPDWYYRLA